MRDRRKKTLLSVAAILFVIQGFLNVQVIHPQWSRDYSLGKQSIASGLNADQMIFALAGFREMIAGILWVRADSFFDTGNYDAILPIIRLVTKLDPHQIDVFATGMWHIGYNFTDEEQRSDRRYIPSALALGKEGCAQNPETYELFFETGWLWYHKIDDDYPEAVNWLKIANDHPDITPARKNLMRNALERDGKPEDALQYMYKLKDQAELDYKQNQDFESHNDLETLINNIDTTVVRLVQRGNLAEKNGYYASGDYDTKNPFDVGFSAKVTVTEPKVIVVEGTWNVLPVGTRIRVILRDANLAHTEPGSMDWDAMATSVQLDPPKDETYMQDQLFVRNRRFNRRIDMSKDPTMYPFSGDRYIIEFYYNPRSAPPHIQDKFGWNGEGMTDSNFLRTDTRPDNERVVYTTLELSRDQILQQGAYAGQVTVVKTKNYHDTAVNTDAYSDVIAVPALRESGAQSAAPASNTGKAASAAINSLGGGN